MCVDFTNLNEACPKDHYPVLDLNYMVNAIARHALLSFIDSFLGYNQIPVHEPDQPSMIFITNQGPYCHEVMPFSLKMTGILTRDW